MKDANGDTSEITIGRRMTQSRKAIIDLFHQMGRPLSVNEIIHNVHANETSVYRTLRTLREAGKLHEIHFPNGEHRYELAKEHHHHIICRSCGYTEHISCPEISTTMASHGFRTVDDHEVTYYGLCTKCA